MHLRPVLSTWQVPASQDNTMKLSLKNLRNVLKNRKGKEGDSLGWGGGVRQVDSSNGVGMRRHKGVCMKIP